MFHKIEFGAFPVDYLILHNCWNYINEIGSKKYHYERFSLCKHLLRLTEVSCKSGIYQERGPKGPDF